MTFYEYATERYINDDSAKGDFVRDMQGDSFIQSTPKLKKFSILGHLYKEGACVEAIAAFEDIWAEYMEVKHNGADKV